MSSAPTFLWRLCTVGLVNRAMFFSRHDVFLNIFSLPELAKKRKGCSSQGFLHLSMCICASLHPSPSQLAKNVQTVVSCSPFATKICLCLQMLNVFDTLLNYSIGYQKVLELQNFEKYAQSTELSKRSARSSKHGCKNLAMVSSSFERIVSASGQLV